MALPHRSPREHAGAMGDTGVHTGVVELAPHECWALLRTAQVGRLAVAVDGAPDIFPLNFAVDHGTVVVRTAEGTKLAATLESTAVAFESDGFDASLDEAWSVVLKGRCRQIEGAHALSETLDLPLHPWEGSPKSRFLRLEPDVITGRRFPVVLRSAWDTPLTRMRRSAPE